MEKCLCSVEPIASLEALLDEKREEPTCPFAPHTPLPLYTAFTCHKVGLNGRTRDQNPPKVIVCHDFRGGYLDDKFVCGSSSGNNYSFRGWLGIDIFIYFSHHFVTIPPLGWVNAAHAHGVKVLGTIITEWKDGEGLCKAFLGDRMEETVTELVRLTAVHGFDGYLLNLENCVESAEKVIEFMKGLSGALKESSPSNLLLYYDSLTSQGALKWQNELNELNKSFFDAADGIFLNYCWDEETLKNSVQASGDRRLDVFVGVDVFGRNCYGGGGLNTHKALEKIREFELSAAIFAPAWTFECHAAEKFEEMDGLLWGLCAPYLGFRSFKSNVKAEGLSLLLHTNFCPGYGDRRFSFGQVVEGTSEWFDLREMAFQPVILRSPPLQEASLPSPNEVEVPVIRRGGEYDRSDGFLGGGCLCVGGEAVWLPLLLPLPPTSSLIVLLVFKGEEPWVELELRTQGIPSRLHLDEADTRAEGPLVNLSYLLSPGERAGLEEEIMFDFQRTNLARPTLSGWTILCWMYGGQDEVTVEGLFIGSKEKCGDELRLGYLSLTACPPNRNAIVSIDL